MPATFTTDVATWIPAVISAAVYDAAILSDYPLGAFATSVPDLEGKAGDRVTIPIASANSAASNLAENVSAVDENLAGSGVTLTIKEAVKSIAYSDRTKFQSPQDINQLAGSRVGMSIRDRIELDLGAALLAGRATGQDSVLGATFGLDDLRLLRSKIPARLRRRGMVAFAKADVFDQLLADTTVANAAAFGSDEAIRNGAFSRPFYGMELVAVDDATFANVTISATTGPPVVVAAKGMLLRALQKNPATEVERDARARLTRIVGTALHAEGVVESAGVVAGVVG